MTVETRSTEAKVTYTVTEVEKDQSFDIDFKFLKNDEMLKAVLRKQDGTTQDLVLDTDYYIEYTGGNNNVWGKLVMIKDYDGLKNICIYRDIPTSQDRIFSSQTIFASVIESSLDKLTMIMQDIQSLLNRALHAPIDDVISVDTMELPPASDGEGYLIRDKDGKFKVTDAAGQSKALRQAKGEISDPTFELNLNERAGKYITFNDEGSVVLKNLPKEGTQSDWDETDPERNSYIQNKPEVVHNLNSDSSTDVLSANMGKILDQNKQNILEASVGIEINSREPTEQPYIIKAKIVDDLADTSTDKMLSANMGKTLNDTKQNNLTAGAGITIQDDVISADYPELIQSDWKEADSTKLSFIQNKPDLSKLNPLTKWSIQFISSSNDWRDVCYGNGVFVAIAYNTNIASYSLDGVYWINTTLPESRNWRAVAFGNGVFIAIAQESNKAARSTDGINWTEITLPESLVWMAIAFGNDRFVVTSDFSNTCAISSDGGITWTTSNLPNSHDWRSVTFGMGKFVTIANNSHLFAYSSNGIDWIENALPGNDKAWYKIYYANGKFIALADNSNIGAISSNGTDWSEITLPGERFLSIAFGNEKYIALPYGGLQAAVSKDCVTWNLADLPLSQEYQAITYGDDKFVAIIHSSNILMVGKNAPIEVVDSLFDDSKDKALSANMGKRLDEIKQNTLIEGNGILIKNSTISCMPSLFWEDTEIPCNAEWDTSICGPCSASSTGFRFVTIGFDSNKVAYSDDGIHWNQATITSSDYWTGIAYGCGRFVVLSQSGIIGHSTDGVNWTTVTKLSSDYNWGAITYGNGLFVAISRTGGKVAYGEDPISAWGAVTLSESHHFTSITYGEEKRFIAVAEDSNICARSVDGVNWGFGNLPVSAYWSSITYGNDLFVAVARLNSNIVAISPDGITWDTAQLSDIKYDWSCVLYGGGKFIAIADGPDVGAYSVDGVNWKPFHLPSRDHWGTLAYCKGRKFVAIARNTALTPTKDTSTVAFCLAV